MLTTLPSLLPLFGGNTTPVRLDDCCGGECDAGWPTPPSSRREAVGRSGRCSVAGVGAAQPDTDPAVPSAPGLGCGQCGFCAAASFSRWAVSSSKSAHPDR